RDKRDDAFILAVVQEDVAVVNDCITSFVELCTSIAGLISVMVVLFMYNALMTGVICMLIPAISIYMHIQSPYILSLSTEQQHTAKRNIKLITEVFAMGEPIKQLELWVFGFKEIVQNIDELQERMRNIKQLNAVTSKLITLMQRSASLAILGLGALVIRVNLNVGALTTGKIVAFFTTGATFHAVRPLRDVHYSYPKPLEAEATEEELLDAKLDGTSVLRGVTIEIARGHKVALVSRTGGFCSAGAALRWEEGEGGGEMAGGAGLLWCVALVSRTGGGKTTLLKCVVRQYQPDQGEVEVGDLPVNMLDIKHTMAPLEQGFKVFLGTIRENICCGEDFEETKIHELALRLAIIGTSESNWVAPDGLDTLCDDSLSDALCQRILIARSLVRERPIVVMDDPVSMQDSEHRYRFGQALKNSYYDTAEEQGLPVTALVATQDLEIMEFFDKIAFMEHGKIVEYGTEKELMDKHGPYFRFCTSRNSISIDKMGNAAISGESLKLCCWLFIQCNEKDLQYLASLCKTRHIKKNEVVYTKGEPCETFYIVADGLVREGSQPSLLRSMTRVGSTSINLDTVLHSNSNLPPGGTPLGTPLSGSPISGSPRESAAHPTRLADVIEEEEEGTAASPAEPAEPVLNPMQRVRNRFNQQRAASRLSKQGKNVPAESRTSKPEVVSELMSGASSAVVERQFKKLMTDSYKLHQKQKAEAEARGEHLETLEEISKSTRDYGAGEHLNVNPLYQHFTDTTLDDFYPTNAVALTDTILLALTKESFNSALERSAQLNEAIMNIIKIVTMRRHPDQLRRLAWPLCSVADSYLDQLGVGMRVVVVPRNQSLVANRMEEQLREFMVIAHGQVMVKIPAKSDRKEDSETALLLEPGGGIGISILEGSDPRAELTTAVSLEDCILLVLDQSSWNSWKEQPDVARAVDVMFERIALKRSNEGLRSMWPFWELPDSVLEGLHSMWTPKRYDDTVMLRLLQVGYIVIEGTVNLTMQDSLGNVSQEELQVGALFNEMELLNVSTTLRIVKVDFVTPAILLECKENALRSYLESVGEWDTVFDVALRRAQLVNPEHLSSVLDSYVLEDIQLALLCGSGLSNTCILEKGESLDSWSRNVAHAEEEAETRGQAVMEAAGAVAQEASARPALQTKVTGKQSKEEKTGERQQAEGAEGEPRGQSRLASNNWKLSSTRVLDEAMLQKDEEPAVEALPVTKKQVSPVLLVVLWGGVEANGTKPAVPGDIYIPPQAKQLFYGDEGVIPEREHVDDLSVSLIASPERADSGTAIGPASSIRKNMLRSKSRARRTSSYNSGLMGQVRLVVADKVVATQRTMLAVIDLAHISSGVTLAMEALKADMAVAEAERLECMAEVQLVSKELHDLQKKLGLRRRLDYVKLWKKVKLAIQFQYVMGKPLVVDGSEPAVEDDLASSISGYTTHALANLMISKTEDLLEAREILQTRLEQVQEIRGEWEEVGLEASDPNGPAAEDDLSWTRLNHLEHIIKERRARVKELCQSAYKQLGELWKKKPPTLDVQQKMYNLAGVGTMDALTHLEEAVQKARTSLQREVKETHKSLSDMLAKLGLSETDRALRLHPASWTVAELLAGQQQLRQLRAMQKACYEAGAGGGKERLQLQLCIEELERAPRAAPRFEHWQ
ncbi:hypothetical protein CYMTET_32303, partial [Cymbomonas tetramitiformis]